MVMISPGGCHSLPYLKFYFSGEIAGKEGRFRCSGKKTVYLKASGEYYI